MNARIKKKQMKIRAKTDQIKIKSNKAAQQRVYSSLNVGAQARVGRTIIRKSDWKKAINVSKEVGKKKYTEGQKNYIRALKVIEEALDKPAADIKALYGSDDIEELANQYYLPELSSYSHEELNEIEREFNKTHGYHIRLENATNPFANIDFNTLMPN